MNLPDPSLVPPPPANSLSDYYHRTIKQLRREPSFAPGGPHFPAIVEHFVPLVYGTALKLIPEHPESALGIAQSVFELLAIKWRSLLKGRTVSGWMTALSLWILRATVSVTSRERKRLRLKKPARDTSAAAHLALFKRFFRLNKKSQRGIIIFHILRLPPVSETPRLIALRKYAAKRVQKLARKLRKTSIGADLDSALAALVVPAPAEMTSAVIDSTQAWTVTAPRRELTRATILSWRLLAIRTFFKRVLATIGGTICVLALLAIPVVILFQRGFFLPMLIEMGARDNARKFPELAQPGGPWPVTPEDHARVRITTPRNSAELYQQTNIYLATLRFTPDSWQAIQPTRIPRVRNMMKDGEFTLRNPEAQRSGLSGVLGLDFNWVHADFEFAGARFTNVAARFRGNGTYVDSRFGSKQSYKIDLNRFVKKQTLAKLDEFNFLNSVADASYVRDSMAERLFRDLGVPAPRTAYVYLSVDVPGKWTNQPIGLYNVVENIDKDFAHDRFGSKKTPIFKPVTYKLFEDLGPNWSDYSEIYDLKTEATAEQLQRVIELARLTSHGSDAEFARRLSEFVDLEVFAGFVAGHVLTSSYDGFFTNGQNFFLYLDPESNRFGFIAWDQDHGWGEFPIVGSDSERERASIWKPWVRQYKFRFLARAMETPAFREIYKRKLEHALEHLFIKERLFAQIDELAATIRPAIAGESAVRLARFDDAVSTTYHGANHRGDSGSPTHQIKRFIEARIDSVRAQLAGESEGTQPARNY
jgi:hypothetical protein